MVSKTRRTKKTAPAQEKTMTIPQLRAAFGALEKQTHDILKTKAPANQVDAFQAAWKKIFKRAVSESAAREYLEFKKSAAPSPSQKGGAAPVSWTMGPGTSEPYGQFQTYMSSGLANYNQINNDSFRSACGREDPTPTPTFAIGNNTNPLARGGARSSKKSMGATRRKQKGGMARLIYPSSVPTSFAADVQARSMGQLPSAPSPSPVDNQVGFSKPVFPIFSASITPTNF
jgi:hypothetical protein